eukprot:15004159-Ditylum_brightwellii.AAC.1
MHAYSIPVGFTPAKLGSGLSLGVISVTSIVSAGGTGRKDQASSSLKSKLDINVAKRYFKSAVNLMSSGIAKDESSGMTSWSSESTSKASLAFFSLKMTMSNANKSVPPAEDAEPSPKAKSYDRVP